jgi:DNA-binding XRE family transcriptional regulator
LTIAQFSIGDVAYAIVPLAEYEALRRLADDFEDAVDTADARRLYAERLEAERSGEDLSLPRDQWARIRAGESPVRVIREHRGLTQAQLADAAGLDQSLISIVEGGRRDGKVSTLKAIAKALGAPLSVIAGAD